MRVVLDYGGVIVHHTDEREHADVLGVSPDQDPYPGWLAYYLYRTGFLNDDAEYVDVLSTLTSASEDACFAYLEQTWLDPDFPADHRDVIVELASEHSLWLFGNMVQPWIETVLQEHGVLDAFDELVVSSEIERPKPHPRGYQRCTEGVDDEIVMVSDEYNEDLLMADTFGMTTVWVENEDDEEPVQEPDYTIQDLTELPSVVDGIQ